MINSADKKMIIASAIGSGFELFDFLSFVFLSSIIAKIFFPPEIQSFAIVFTYLTITISYLFRPIGGLILAHIGDKYGRKFSFTFSILLMSIPSFVISILPTFHSIGYFATALIIIARIFQGFSLGGEVPGSITYIAEKFKNKNYYFYCAWLTFGANFGLAIGSQFIHILNENTSPEFMLSIGWRIPFFVGGFLTILGFYIRYSLSETKEFKDLQHNKKISKIPLLTLLKEYKQQVVCAFFLCVIVSLTTSIFHVFLPNLFTNYYKLSINNTTNMSVIGALVMAVFSLLFAFIVRFMIVISVLRISLCGLIFVLIITYSNITQINDSLQYNLFSLYFIVIIISITLTGVNGLFFGILASLFPTKVRFTGISFSYNLAYIIGAGLTPLWTSLIIEKTNGYSYIIAVCLVVAAMSLISTIPLNKLMLKSNELLQD
jgi:MFS family permease